MPVLRSRRIPSPPLPPPLPPSKTKPKSKTKTLINDVITVIKPSTPTKLTNSPIKQSNPSLSNSRRRSLRLVYMNNSAGNSPDSSDSTRKRGRSGGLDRDLNEVAVESFETESEVGLRSLENARVSDSEEEVSVVGDSVENRRKRGLGKVYFNDLGVLENVRVSDSKEFDVVGDSVGNRRKRAKGLLEEEEVGVVGDSVGNRRNGVLVEDARVSDSEEVNVIRYSVGNRRKKGKEVLVEDARVSDSEEVTIIGDSLGNRRKKAKGVLVRDAIVLDSEEEVDVIGSSMDNMRKRGRVGVDGESEYLSFRSGSRVGKRVVELSDDEMIKDKGKSVFVGEENDGLSFSLSDNGVRGSRRFTKEEKGKGKMVNDDSDMVKLKLGLNYENVDLNVQQNGVDGIREGVTIMDDLGSEIMNLLGNVGSSVEEDAKKAKYMKDQFKDIARRNAHKYAHFNAREEGRSDLNVEDEQEQVRSEEPIPNVEDWPGPFLTAMKIIRDREKNMSVQMEKLPVGKGGFPLVSWIPRKEKGSDWAKQVAPSLQDLCLSILAKNVDAITSLQFVPDVLRHKLSQALCDSRRMNVHFLELLLEGSPSELRLADCSWLEEDKFEKLFGDCDTRKLTVLQLDLCGHCVSDTSLVNTLLPRGLPVLTTVSLRGACRISDAGLTALVSCARALRSLNLSQCSLVTDVGINNLANSLGPVLRELYLDDCDSLDALLILPALKTLQGLEVLSLRGIVSVSDKFMKELIISTGQNLKELTLAHCQQLTDSSLRVIAETCSQLYVLDLSHLTKLTDIGMAHLANGCHEIQDLKLCRNAFSDDAIAAFLEASGASLKELSLNNITAVGQNTTISLARRCKNIHSLDLSWCRRLTDEALGLIADSCFSLRVLKLFGCTQVTSTFLDGHSNAQLQVIGLKLSPILANIKRPDFQQGPLHYSGVSSI